MTNPLVNLGDLTKPATVLIEKISDALGGFFRPHQIVRVARAEAEADQIRAESQIRVTELQKRAMYRFLDEEAKRQSNIEDITRKALPLLEEESSPQDVEDDWITNFFEKCRIVSDEDMQRLWSKVLAGQANDPGAFSRRTVNLLADLDKNDAQLFARLCGFVWMLGSVTPADDLNLGPTQPIVFDTFSEVYTGNGINFASLAHLESLGLIRFGSMAGFWRTGMPKGCTVSYCGRPLELTFPKDAENQLAIGLVLLTRAGQELLRVCDSRPVDGFFDYVYDRWATQFLVPKRRTEPGTQPTG
jgi:hypothetical protein